MTLGSRWKDFKCLDRRNHRNVDVRSHLISWYIWNNFLLAFILLLPLSTSFSTVDFDICLVFTSASRSSFGTEGRTKQSLMIEASDIDRPDGEVKILTSSLEKTRTTRSAWLNRARIISALVYILFLLAYLIFIIVCIAVYPRCERAPATPWWVNSVFLPRVCQQC